MELRRYAEPDRALTAALESDPRVMAHLGGPGDDADDLHEERLAGDLYFTIVLDEPVGVIAAWRSDQDVYELGVLIKPEHQARGLAEQAIGLLLPHLRERGIDKLHAFITVTNKPSHAVAERVGFRRAGERDLDYRGHPLRCVHWILDV